jgi:hypothetical protein
MLAWDWAGGLAKMGWGRTLARGGVGRGRATSRERGSLWTAMRRKLGEDTAGEHHESWRWQGRRRRRTAEDTGGVHNKSRLTKQRRLQCRV